MKILISPAKSIGQQNLQSSIQSTEGVFLTEAESLAKKLQKFSSKKIEKLMHVSNDIASLNYERFQAWEKPVDENDVIRPAIAQFTGEVYRGLDAESLTSQQMEFAQNHLRILSGMYGILKPMDLMYPYRLEMGTSWAITPKTKNLYQFWGTKLSKQLNREMENEEVIVNLASAEYFKAIDKKVLKAKVITPHFKELKNGEYKIVAIFAKNARGKMARYSIENEITEAKELKKFDWDGYLFHESLSNETDWVFTR
jgi:uncharacterized protein